ncbi:PREDICTED: uncharacterized protein LOC105577263 isoform X1 [Cercocebus atys]|uniref:uncharacterized protein LOC105577263 isoform X1 n=1 Tax=Cercocebus atys TaxID=9531 RepID=UPI0005F50000|nr:PREDICTED: uncharacterized protein LOC105577263 isoform X1 [Cercocebus atys]
MKNSPFSTQSTRHMGMAPSNFCLHQSPPSPIPRTSGPSTPTHHWPPSHQPSAASPFPSSLAAPARVYRTGSLQQRISDCVDVFLCKVTCKFGEVPSPKEPPLMLGDTCLDFLSQDQHPGSSPRPAPSLLLPAPGENEHPLKDSDSPHGAWPIPQPQPVAAAHPLAHRPAGADLALAPLSGEGHACWRQPGWTGKSDGGPKLEASTPGSTDHPKVA